MAYKYRTSKPTDKRFIEREASPFNVKQLQNFPGEHFTFLDVSLDYPRSAKNRLYLFSLIPKCPGQGFVSDSIKNEYITFWKSKATTAMLLGSELIDSCWEH